MSVNRRDFLKIAGASLGGALLHTSEAAAETPAAEAASHPAMLYDTTLCVGCRACQTACRDWNDTPVEWDAERLNDAPTDLSGKTWTVIQLYQEGETMDRDSWAFIKRNCMHCIDPACVSACTVGALQKSEAGPVIYDVDRCFGCRYCMVACPYHVPRYQWESTTPLVQKCTFCYGYVQPEGEVDDKNRLAQGLGPNCVEACPTGALSWGPREEMLALARSRLEAEPDRYIPHIYGEHEIGGTLQLYLSHLPFEKLGLPRLAARPLPTLTDAVNLSVPAILVGMTGLMSAVYWVRRRAEEDS